MHIVITGASSGIGLAIAKALDQPGNRLTLVARRQTELEALQGTLGCDSQVIVADLSRGDDPIAWLREAEATFGATDVLVNNAALAFVESALLVDQARVNALFQVNVHTPIAAIAHVLPTMVARGQGAIVNVASNAAFQPAPYFAHYCSTKAALATYSESLRFELAGSGVHVTTVYPGPVRTPMADRNFARVKASTAVNVAPVGDADVLAKLVVNAVKKKRARVVYPRFYALGWWLPGIGRFLVERVGPKLLDKKT